MACRVVVEQPLFHKMSHASTSRLPEFQAVILCGHGEDLYPLTAASGSSGLPKALLPVANKPLVEGVLKWIEQAGLSGAASSHTIIREC